MAITSIVKSKPAAAVSEGPCRLRKLDRMIERWLLLNFYSLIILTVAIEVIRRFLLNYSSVWGEEVARYAFIYLVWLAAAAAVRDRSHIRIDALVGLAGLRAKRLAWWIADLATLVLAGWGGWLSVSMVVTSWKFGVITPGLQVPQFLFLLAIPLGCALIVVRVIQVMMIDIERMRVGQPVDEGRKLFD